MSYKVIKDDKKFYQVMHPDGTKFTVPKNGLSKSLLDKISKLPKHFAGGSIVEDPLPQQTSLPVVPTEPVIPPEAVAVPNRILSDLNAQFEYEKNLTPNTPDEILRDRAITALEAQKKLTDERNLLELEQAKKATPVKTFDERVAALSSVVLPKDKQAEMTDAERMQAELAKQNQSADETPISPQMSDISQSFNQAMGGIADQMRAEKNYIQAIEAQVASGQKKMDALDAERKEKLAIMRQAGEEKIKQGNFWGVQGTGNKIVAALSVALGGIGAGLSGKENAALAVLNKAMETDLQLQKEQKNSLYNIALNEYNDAKTAEDAVRLQQAQQLELMAKKFGAQSKTAEMKQKAAELQMNYAQKAAELSQKLLGSQIPEQIKAKAFTGQLSPQEILALPEDKRVLYVPGGGFATNPEGAKKVRESSADALSMTRDLSRLKAIREQYGRETLPTEVKKEAQILASSIKGKLRVPILGPGTVNDSERKIIDSLLNADVTSLMTLDSTVMSQIDTLQGIVKRNFSNMLKAEGMTPAIPDSVNVASGKIPRN